MPPRENLRVYSGGLHAEAKFVHPPVPCGVLISAPGKALLRSADQHAALRLLSCKPVRNSTPFPRSHTLVLVQGHGLQKPDIWAV